MLPYSHDLRQRVLDAVERREGSWLSGVTAAFFPGATNAAIFESYLEDILAPELHSGDVVIWDKLTSHKSKEAAEAIAGPARCRRRGVRT
jgi:hypothetical protein